MTPSSFVSDVNRVDLTFRVHCIYREGIYDHLSELGSAGSVELEPVGISLLTGAADSIVWTYNVVFGLMLS